MVALCCSCLKPSDVAETSPTTELLAKATQLSATETAAATAKRVAQAARRVSAAEKAAVGSQWVSAGGPAMEAMLVSTDLVDAQYLVALAEAGGIVPSWQECPLEARINRDSVWRLRCWGFVNLPVLVLSYPWLDAHHPDRLGETLRSIVPVLRALLAKAAEYGTHATIGVLWDFLSLPQKPYRDEAEAARFKAGLRSINSWYSHPCTHVLLVKTPLPVGADYGNTRPYSARGWTYFEERMSAVVKDDYCLWDLSRYEGAADYVTCLRQMRHQRLPPTSPERVAAELREGVASGALAFTASADLETVIGLYSRGFETAFDSYRAIREGQDGVLYYKRLGWQQPEAFVLAEALEYAASHCSLPDGGLVLKALFNDFGDDGRAAISRAIAGSRLLVDFDGSPLDRLDLVADPTQ